MKNVYPFFKKYWPTIAPILLAGVLAASDAAQQALTAHPKTAFVGALLGMLMAHWKQSPKAVPVVVQGASNEKVN